MQHLLERSWRRVNYMELHLWPLGMPGMRDTALHYLAPKEKVLRVMIMIGERLEMLGEEVESMPGARRGREHARQQQRACQAAGRQVLRAWQAADRLSGGRQALWRQAGCREHARHQESMPGAGQAARASQTRDRQPDQARKPGFKHIAYSAKGSAIQCNCAITPSPNHAGGIVRELHT